MKYTLFLLLSSLSMLMNVIGLDIGNLIYQYVMTCGFERLCNISNFNLPYRLNFSYLQNNAKICPNCGCDSECMTRQDCCPDFYFSQTELLCLNVTLLNNFPPNSQHGNKQERYPLVSTCPNGTDTKLKEQCTGSKDIIQSLKTGGPVSNDEGLRLSYRNKYCAECNSVQHFTNWMLDIDCVDFADFNYLSTYDEVVDLAKERKCNILFKSRDKNIKPCSSETNIIGVCNVTGKWKEFDADIEFACKSSYNRPYRSFKNIFCYVCNPSDFQKQETVVECNVTGLWEPSDPVLESACRYYRHTHTTFPYKNIFCYFCNRNNAVVEAEEIWDHSLITYIDTKTEIEEKLNASSFKYFMIIRNYNLEYLQSVVSEGILNDSLSKSNVVQEQLKSESINNLIKQYTSFQSSPQICTPFKWLPDEVLDLIRPEYCSCNNACAFSYQKCCIDSAFEQSYTCLPADLYSLEKQNTNTSNSFLVVDTCSRNSDAPFSKMCQMTEMSNIISLIPVSNYLTNVVSRNIFCAFCNSGVQDTKLSDSDLDELLPHGIDITCEKNYIYYAHSLSFYDVFRHAQNVGCNIRLHNLNDFDLPCSRNDYLIDKCNVTGFWPEIDTDVLYACERLAVNILPRFREYKNVFCYLCNPQPLNGSVISSCNMTGLWKTYNSNLESACMNMSLSYVTHPYKNRFCQLCNLSPFYEGALGVDSGYGSPVVPDNLGGSTKRFENTITINYRSIFALSSYQGHQSDKNNNNDELCDVSQVQDKTNGICRNISCYPGKYLSKDTCTPLFPVTKNLRYTLSFMLTGNGNIAGMRNIDILHIIRNKIKRKLTKEIHVASFISFYILSNFPCSKIATNTTHMNFFVYTNFFIEENVHRLHTETFLTDITQTAFNFTIKGETIAFESRPSQRAFYLPSVISKLDYRHSCHFYQHENFTFEPEKEFRSSYVSKLLLCRQIKLNKNDFIINIEKTELFLSNLGYYLKYNEFEITRNGMVLVCLSDRLMNLLSTDQPQRLSETEYSLRIVTMVTIIVSLVCLLVTFFTHCVFPVLRSVPGQNNMCLVFAMFFSQLMFLISTNPKSVPSFCKAVGVISHFFWLCMFFCMNVCSFHMFHVFAGSLTTGSSKTKTGNMKVVFRYILYSYGCPMVIVILNILITFFVTGLQNIGYGNNKCFITSLTSYIVTMLVPVIVLCILNIYFFVVTGYKIKNTPRVQCNQSDRHNFIVYVKLFTLTGISWIFQIIDSFLPLSAFSFIVTIFNGFQGLFVFLSYICNKRVFNLYKTLFKDKRKTDSTLATNSSTKTTELNLTS